MKLTKYFDIPKGLNAEELKSLLNEYAKTRNPELKVQICLGSLYMIAVMTERLFVEAKFVKTEDIFELICTELYEKLIDGYADKLLEGADFQFSTYISMNIRKIIHLEIKREKTKASYYATSWEEAVARDKKSGEEFKLIDTLQTSPDFRENEESKFLFEEVVGLYKYLPAAWQKIFELYYFEHLTEKEIGNQLGITKSRTGQILQESAKKLHYYYEHGVPQRLKNSSENTQMAQQTL